MKGPLECFKEMVPRKARIAILILFSFVFQFTGVVYLTLMEEMADTGQFDREDIQFLYQAGAIGITFAFPLLFRIKFRFTTRQIITGCSLLLGILMALNCIVDAIPALLIFAFLIGFLKMVGTFEALVSLQLVITPSRDYGEFFSVALGIVLLSGQASGALAVVLADLYHWKMMYVVMMTVLGVQAWLALLLMRPFRMVRKIPLYGIDWKGLVHWTILFLLVSYVFAYGAALHWFASWRICLSAAFALVWAGVVCVRSFRHRRAFIAPAVFRLRNTNIAIVVLLLTQFFLNASGSLQSGFAPEIMKWDNLHASALNWWVAGGILPGALFSFWWFNKIKGEFRIIFAIGFAVLTLHHIILYFGFRYNTGPQPFYLSYFLKGSGNIILFAAAGKLTTIGVPQPLFAQMLCYLAMFRNVLGNVGMHSFFSSWSFKLARNPFKQSVPRMDPVLFASQEILGRVAVGGIIIVFLVLLYRFTGSFIALIPSWKKIVSVTKAEARQKRGAR